MSNTTTGIFWVVICVAAAALTLLVGSQFVGGVDWSLVIAVSAIFVAVYTSYITHRFSKIDRAYSHSIYKSDRYLDAFDKLVVWFPELDNSSPSLDKPEEIYEILNKYDKNRRQINIALNHWGRFASEYYADVLDRERAREMLKPQFNRFFVFFVSTFVGKIQTPNGTFLVENSIITRLD